jgi:Serine/threonine protein kinase
VHNRLDETGCLAPEQLSGLSKQDARADLYAVGVLLYQMLTGEARFSVRAARRLPSEFSTSNPNRPVR